MSMEASEYAVDEANAKQLTFWLTAGKWSWEQATLLFQEIDPDRQSGECFSTFSGHGEVQYEYFDEERKIRVPYGVDEEGEPVYLTAEQDDLLHKTKQLCREIGMKLNLYDSAEPHEWIELACKKGVAIPWLNWAIARGLCIQKQDPCDVSNAFSTAPEVELSVRESRPAANGPLFTMKKAAIIDQHKHKWPTIEQDIKDAGRNGLNKAKAGERDWNEAEAMEWARVKGKLISTNKPTDVLAGAMGNMASLPSSRKHTCER